MSKKILRVYVDSTVVGGKFNKRLIAQTKSFWEAFTRGEFIVVISDILEQEAVPAPQRLRDFLGSLPESQIERVASTSESDNLAVWYIAKRVVDESSLNDCRHIALATIAGADAVVSWNMKHMVKRSDGYNSVNESLGYPQVPIKTPEDLMR
jgi:predicted nucleic acid-binding protein